MTTDPFAELGGLRRLARSLARDEADADDLLQDVAVIALEHPPKQDRPARPWLAKVIVNRWRMELRANRRRRAREAAVELDAPDPIDPLERAQTLQRLGEAVVALPAPYREVLIAHYFDAKPCHEIARELGIPAVTVRSRLLRAREQLRAALDDVAPRQRWRRALVPLVLRSRWFAPAGIPLAVPLALVAVAVVGATLLGVRASGPTPEVASSVRVAPAGSLRADGRPALDRAFVEAAATGGTASGRVIDVTTGRGIANAELAFASDGGAIAVHTNDAGDFELVATQPGSYHLESVIAAGFFPFIPSPMQPSVQLELARDRAVRDVAVFLAPEVALHGRVLDETGRPVAGAQAFVDGPSLTDSSAAVWTSDVNGRFTFHASTGTVLQASLGDRHGWAYIDRGVSVAKYLEIKIARVPPHDATISGRVVDEAGTPIADARVHAVPERAAMRGKEERFGDAVATTGPDGGFVLTGLDGGPHDLFAEVTERAPTASRHVAAGARDVTLTLGPGEPITGRVVTRAGVPVPVFDVLVYRRSGAARELVTSRAIVHADGRFAVRLEPGRYDVIARARGWAPSAAAAASPGTAIELVVDEGARLTGTVVAAATGAPIAGAHVAVEGLGGHSAIDDFGVVTGADGKFELRGVSAGPVSISTLAEGFETRIEAGLVARDGAFAPVTVALGTPMPGEERLTDYVGIGVLTRPEDDDIVVEKVYANGGAQAAGLVPGDRIVTIDGVPVTEIGDEMAVTRIQGPKNTTVSLGLRRDGVIRTVVVQRRPQRG